MFFKIDKPKIVAGLKNFFNWRSNSNNRNQTVHIENLTINLYQQPGGAVPEGQIYQKLGIGDLFNLLLEGIRAQDHPVHGAWARTREQMLEYLYNRTRRG